MSNPELNPEIEKVDLGDTDALLTKLGISEETNPEAVKAFKTLAGQKAHFRAKAEKLAGESETTINGLKEQLSKLTPPEKKEPAQPNPAPVNQSKLTLSEALRLRSAGYSDQEVLTLGNYADRLGVSIDEVANDPFIKAGIEAERAKVKSSEATPPPSGAAITIAEKPLTQLTDAEIKANYAEIARKAVDQGRKNARGGA